MTRTVPPHAPPYPRVCACVTARVHPCVRARDGVRYPNRACWMTPQSNMRDEASLTHADERIRSCVGRRVRDAVNSFKLVVCAVARH